LPPEALFRREQRDLLRESAAFAVLLGDFDAQPVDDNQ